MVGTEERENGEMISVSKRAPLRRSPRVWALALVGMATLSGVLLFLFWSSFHDRLLGYSGYGLAPIAVWLLAFVLALILRPRVLRRYHRHWLASAPLVAASLGILSFFHGEEGIFMEASLGGSWGKVVAGSPMVLGALKVAALLALVPLLLTPRRATRYYQVVLKTALKALAAVLLGLGKAIVKGLRLVVLILHTVGRLRHLLRPRWLRRITLTPKLLARSISDPREKQKLEELAASLELPQEDALPHATSHFPPEGEPTQADPEEQQSVTPGRELPTTVREWRTPSIDLLSRPVSRQVPEPLLQEMARHIETTLNEHGVQVAVENIKPGPRVIRFGLVPGWVKKYREKRGLNQTQGDSLHSMEMSRVKVHSILAREKDLALALKTPQLRLEAPVPGESVVGIEVPSPSPSLVALHPVVESLAFQQVASASGLAIALGEGTGGDPVVVDLRDMPHLLIAGATGSGKSVCINTIIASLILSSGPDRLRLLMVDPKRVELTNFNPLPHLLTPVIVETDQVIKVLQGVLGEMFRRYRLMEEEGVRNIEAYRKKTHQPMPYLVLIIDELADMMIGSAYEAEQALVRLAQLGRATGIHLILATQRPSVNVVTGLMKANIPSRIAFAVASQVDSRVILDSAGAEKLLGKGDMLFLSSDSPSPKRLQGTFVSDREIEKLIQFWTMQQGPVPPNIRLNGEPDAGKMNHEELDEDELLNQAVGVASRYKHISPSVLQRRLQIGYPRALRLMELLEREGIVAPGEPGKSREVLVREGQ